MMEPMKSLRHLLHHEANIDVADFNEDIDLDNMLSSTLDQYFSNNNKPLTHEFQDHENISTNLHQDLPLHEDHCSLELEGHIYNLTHLPYIEKDWIDTHFSASNLDQDQVVSRKPKQDANGQHAAIEKNRQFCEAKDRVSHCNRQRSIWHPSLIHAYCKDTKQSESNGSNGDRGGCNKRKTKNIMQVEFLDDTKMGSKRVKIRKEDNFHGKSVKRGAIIKRTSSNSDYFKQQASSEGHILTFNYQHHMSDGDGDDDDERQDDNEDMNTKKNKLLGCKNQKSSRRIQSNNLVSERRRRLKLNERLYTLRALVPNISKMDKASIIGDAIDHVRDLKKKIEDMEVDIAQLEACKDNVTNGLLDPASKHKLAQSASSHRINKQDKLIHWILELHVTRMDEKLFQLQIHCKKTPGVMLQLARALESLRIDILNGSLTTVNDNILNTFVIEVDGEHVIKSEDLREKTLAVIANFGIFLWKSK